MTLQSFSHALLALYDAAERADPAEFAQEAVAIAGRVIRFDGALLGTGYPDTKANNGLVIDRAYVHNRSACLPGEYERVSALDPVGKSLMSGMQAPLAIDCPRFYGKPHLSPVSQFAHRHSVRKLLLFGDRAPSDGNGQWLALYRSEDDEFDRSDATQLASLWSHIARSTKINMERALSRIDPHETTRAHALLNPRGLFEVASPAFFDILKLEWPGFQARTMPLQIINALIGTGIHRGRRIEITASQRFGYMACTARRIPVIDTLAPSEFNVADRYAKGMTHSQIAANLKVSPHTVRNQLAQVYLKLGIHSKVDLVRAMSSRQR